jgi:glycosyltransferase involved in cell wall biosynthesis
MTLTIIVCTIPERAQLLGRCLWYLEHQSDPDFDTLIVAGKQGKGDKLNRAYWTAETTHVMVCDDDDWISPNLVAAVKPYDTDYVGYDALQLVGGRYATTIHQETASHICPIKTDLARAVPFGNTYLDDIRWTRAVAPLVRSETYLDDTLYFYDKWVKPGGGWSPPREVGYWPHDKQAFRWI